MREKLRRTFRLERASLAEPVAVVYVIDLTRREGHIKMDLLKFQLLDADKHTNTSPLLQR
jgi:hypothetical protein